MNNNNMLKLAKTESKKEMVLRKKKKPKNKKIIKNLTEKINKDKSKEINNYINKNISQNITDRQNICQNNKNISNNRIIPKIVKKEYMTNKNNNYIQKNNIPKPSRKIIIIKNKNNNININNNKIRLKAKSPNNLSPIHRGKKIFSLKKSLINEINLKKCDSFKNKYKNDINYSFNRALTAKKEKKESNTDDILKNVENGRIRKLFAMASDIFNLDNTATNLIKRTDLSPKMPNFYKTMYKKDNNNIFRDVFNLSNENKNYNNILSNNILGMARTKNNKNHNRINFFNRSEYNQNETNSFNSKGLKTNRSNMESVKYDIISTRKSNIFDKYKKLSGEKASASKIEDYEILVPQNYNKANVYNLRNVLGSNGLHIFNLKEEGDVIGGQKGKFKIKVRVNGQNEKDKNKIINNVSNKLLNMDVKLKKNSVDLGKKKTDITGYGWEKSIKNRLY